MRFGRTPLDEALGAVVAHTLRLGDAGVIKKGRRLTARDLGALRAAGHTEVVAARLEDDDVAEDEAAARLARLLAGPGVRPAAAATGRCNLHAAADGVVLVDAARIDVVNRVDESITVATVAPATPVREGDLCATIKVIPYAVPRPLLESCEAAVEGAAGLCGVAAFRGFRAGLVLTLLPGVHDSVLDRGAAAQRVRAERLGGRVVRELRCAHDEAQVAAAVTALLDEGCDLIMVLGASAIADRLDVVPAGIERAGGRIEHFGMPVDPGNLLLLARRGEVPLLGVPGCARSLKRSGFDLVLERLSARLPVDRGWLSSLGVGGLLVEAPSRPSPRLPEERAEPAATPARPRVGAVVLAAGHSRRMGARNKLLIPVDGTPMVARVVDALLGTAARPIVVVTGHDAEQVRASLGDRPVRFAHNAEHERGMSTSLRAGIDALVAHAGDDPLDGALVCLGDMPRLAPAHVEALLGTFDPDWPPAEGAPPDHGGRRPLCVPVFEGQRGNPVLFARRYFDELRALSGDVGAKALIERHDEAVRRVPVADDGVLLDIDTPETLWAVTHKDD